MGSTFIPYCVRIWCWLENKKLEGLLRCKIKKKIPLIRLLDLPGVSVAFSLLVFKPKVYLGAVSLMTLSPLSGL